MPPFLDRRDFLRSTGAATALGLLGGHSPATRGPRPTAGRLRVAVLREAAFPAADAPAPRAELLATALAEHDVEYLAAAGLRDRLLAERWDVFVSPYGSAFPVEGWPALKRYLDAGGGWVNLGGVPCAVPVERGASGWLARPREANYHKQLGIVLACAVDTSAVADWRAAGAIPWAARLAAGLAPQTVWEPYYRLTSLADTPDESGSAGPREAVVRPLVSGFDAEGWPVAAPLVVVDRVAGEYAGGRWILATLDGELPAATLLALVAAAARGPLDVEARPSFACYRNGERPSVRVTRRGFPRGDAAPLVAACRVTVSDEHGTRLCDTRLDVRGTDASASGTADLAAVLPDPLAPGLYRLDAAIDSADGTLEAVHATGFWVWDEALLARGASIAAGPFALTSDGEPFPAAGTTYMASDVHRKFLLEPNPALWDRDFGSMARAGVNLVRTGIWTGWQALMPRDGAFDEGALRALDAWLLTARRHGVPVIFTLFAFLPETWGGENPYLDPAALERQRAFVSVVARRYQGMRDLLWDLINEPSFCNKDHLWSCRPNYDRFERAAWAQWLRERRVPDAPLPPLDAFGDGAPDSLLVLEYRLFAQTIFARWARAMRAVLHAAGSPRQLVTVGQDEAGTRDSPNNLFLAPELDFTCVHTWWLNDDVVWDEVLTRRPGKANLVEETGVMFSAHPPGVEERWEEYARDLLERKMAFALGPGGAGFVEWLWSSNCYMPSDNEAAIGLLRADGTAKPELGALRGVAAFVAAARPHLVGREEEPVLMVVPHSNMFSTRDTATAATKRAVRAMQYGCRVGLAAISELAAVPQRHAPALVLVPSPRVLTAEAWAALHAWAQRGARVLVTGPLAQLIPYASRPAIGPSGAVRIRMGRGALLWAPEAVELMPEPSAAATLYRWALAEAGIEPAVVAPETAPTVLVHAARYQGCVLLTSVTPRGEPPRPIGLRYREPNRGFDVSLPARRVNLLLVRRSDGRAIASYPAA
jgi:hypothetical protein